MKYILTITIFLSSSLFANYAFTGENTGKIDMHGGKSDKLIINKNTFLSPNFSSLSDIKVRKPKAPKEPKELIIKKIQKDIKEEE